MNFEKPKKQRRRASIPLIWSIKQVSNNIEMVVQEVTSVAAISFILCSFMALSVPLNDSNLDNDPDYIFFPYVIMELPPRRCECLTSDSTPLKPCRINETREEMASEQAFMVCVFGDLRANST